MKRQSWYAVTAVVVVAVLALAATVVVQAQGPGGNRAGQGPGPVGSRVVAPRGPMCPTAVFMPLPLQRMQQIFAELELSPEQQTKAMDLVKACQDKLAKIRSESHPVQDLVTEMKANPTDATKVQNLANQAIKQEGSILQAELEMWLALDKMLTPKQQVRFWELVFAARPMGPPAADGATQRGVVPPPPPPPSQ